MPTLSIIASVPKTITKRREPNIEDRIVKITQVIITNIKKTKVGNSTIISIKPND